MPDKIYDTIIIGAGPAGLTAAIYASRYRLDCVVLGENVGGTANLAHDVENWPGFKGSGMELMQKFREHVDSFKVPVIEEAVKEVKENKGIFTVSTEEKRLKSHSIILATGTKHRTLGVPGEEEFLGKGVSYCATCDAAFFREKTVGVVGGSNGAAMSAQILAQHAKKVYMIYRKSVMPAEPARVEDLKKNKKVEFVLNANVTEIIGDKTVNKVKLDTGKEISLDGLFIEIGGIPVIAIAKSLGVKVTENDKVIVNPAMETNIPGVLAAGDITTGSNEFNQIITASAEGALAALGSFNFVRKKVK